MMTIYAWLILAALLSCNSTQEITIKDFSYKHSKKDCTNFLIDDNDVVEFTCLVDYSEEPDVTYVIFQTKKTTETRFIFLSDCYIQENCKDSENAQGSLKGNDTIEITITVNAKSSLSAAKLRGLLYTDKGAITSSEVIFPHIKDLNEAECKLIINGETITPSTECHEVITRPELNIVFLCESQGSPCLIEISTDDTNETSQASGNATWNKEYPSQSEVNVLIKYGVCNLNGHSKTVSCKLNFEYESTTNENDGSNNPILLWLCVPAVMMIMILLCVLVIKFKKKSSHCSGTRRSYNVKDSSECHGETGVLFENEKTKDDELSKETVFESAMETKSNNKTARRRRPVTDEPYKGSFWIPLVIDTLCTAPERKNLMKYFTPCQKREKHGSFIPIDKFIIEDLPNTCCKSDLFDLIKYISELTVKVTVNYISYQRPGFYPGTDRTYPFHEKRGNNLTRFGTGLVKNVIRTENGLTCPCHKCLHSGNDSKVCAKIYIATSKSLVFDDSEAQKTTFKINFDQENGIYHYVEGLRVTQTDIDTDNCEVECVTCDEGLLNMLYLKPNKCMQIMADVNSKYNLYEEKYKLTIIVSHPHGCPKQVSIGHWTNRLVVGDDGSRQYTKYVYTTPTCPGCIGAFVYILGASDISLKHHMHCGVNKENENFCNTGMEKICTETL